MQESATLLSKLIRWNTCTMAWRLHQNLRLEFYEHVEAMVELEHNGHAAHPSLPVRRLHVELLSHVVRPW